MIDFKDFIEAKNDRIYDLSYNLLNELFNTGIVRKKQLEWDMSLIGELAEFAERILMERNIPTCYPFYEGDEEKNCPEGNDCKRKDCPFRKKGE